MANTLPTKFDLTEGQQGAFLGSVPVNLAYISGSFKPLSTQTVAYVGETAMYGVKDVSIPTQDLRMYVNANLATSYPGSGSTWFDVKSELNSLLTTDRNLDVGDSPDFYVASGSTPAFFNFTDGFDAAVYKPGGTLSSLTSQGDQYSVCMFFAYEDQNNTYRTIMRVANGSVADDFFLVNANTNNLGIYDTDFRSLGVNVATDIPDYAETYNFQVLTVDDGAAGDDTHFYLNDSETALGSTASPLRYDGPAIFGNQETGGQAGARISAILVYDRVITTEERLLIYNNLSAQMGLS